MTLSQGGGDQPDLTISPDTVCTVIMLAREYGVKDEVSDPDTGSNPADDRSTADDPVEEELMGLITSLDLDEQIDLVAIAWLGRDEHGPEDWGDVRQEAADAHNARTASYLRSIPLLADYLAEGLSILGYSCEELEREHL